MPTRTFTVAELNGLDVGPWNCTENYEGEAHRWYTVRHLVFEHEGAHWMVDYLDPASEIQEDQARWDMSTNDAPGAEVTAVQVERVPRVVERFEPVDREHKPPAKIDDDALNLRDFLGKIEWEGGVAEAIEYGLGPEDLSAEAREQNPEIAQLWDTMHEVYAPFEQLSNRWQTLVDAIDITGDDEEGDG